MLYVGLDCHARFYMIAVLEEGRGEARTRKVEGSMDHLVQVLRQEAAGRPLAICYEAGVSYGALYDRLCRVAQRVVVADPRSLRMIWASKRKNDRVDASKLAKLLALDAVPSVHVPPLEVRSWRRMICHRKKVVQQRSAIKSQLRMLARGCGLEAPAKPWSRAGRDAWVQLAWPSEGDRFVCENLLLELDSLEDRVRRATRQLDRIGRRSPAVQLLQTIPGIGPRNAEALAAWIDQPQRFARNRQISTYLGLVPRQDQSGSTNRLGHITRDGPGLVRGLLIEAAWTAVRCDATYRALFQRISQGKKDRRKIAIVAVANKLARTALAMLQTGEVYATKDATQSTTERAA